MMGTPSPLVFLPDEIQSWQNANEALCAALEQQEVVKESLTPEQEPIWYHKHWAEDDDIFYRPTEAVPDGAVPLYLHPQNLNCKSNQARLATLWGYEKPQPPRQPLTYKAIDAIIKSNFFEITNQNLYDAIYLCMRDVESMHDIEEQE